MKKIMVILGVLLLAGCGGGGSSGGVVAPTNANTIATPVITPNTGTIIVNANIGDVISIGASGSNSKTVGASGSVVFTGVLPGAVNIHAFSADGYSAASYYGINSDVISFSMNNRYNSNYNQTTSVIDIYSTTVNAGYTTVNAGYTTVNAGYILDDGAGNIYQSNITDPITHIASIQIAGIPAGSIITGTLYATNKDPAIPQASSSAGNQVSGGLSGVINLGFASFTTRSQGAVGNAISYSSVFPINPPAIPVLFTIQSITPPTGFIPVSASVSIGSTRILGIPLNLPDTLRSAYIPGNNNFSVSAISTPYVWSVYINSFPVGSPLNISATMTTAPKITANQTGSTIRWTESTDSFVFNNLTIYDAVGHTWDIFTPKGISSITLPRIPAAATSPLTLGMAYKIDMMDLLFLPIGWTFEQGMSSSGTPSGAEAISRFNIAYTR